MRSNGLINKLLNDKNDSKQLSKITILEMFCLFIVETILLYYIFKMIPFVIDSDSSSELLLSKILNDEGKIITDSWYYSTELRVLNNQLIYSFFFSFFKTWRYVRIASIFCLHIILFLCLTYHVKQLNNSKHFVLPCFFVIFALTWDYFKIVICESYYIPHISISLLSTAFSFSYSRMMDKKENIKKAIMIILLSSILSFLSGLGGVRQVVITFFPLLLTSLILFVWDIYLKGISKNDLPRSFHHLTSSAIMFIFNCVGLLINETYLRESYYFESYETLEFTSFDSTTISIIINDIMAYFGYTTGSISLYSLLKNGICIAMVLFTIILLFNGLKKNTSFEYKTISLFIVASLIILIGIHSFTQLMYAFRYLIPTMFFTIPLFYIGLSEIKLGNFPKFSRTFIIIIISIMCFSRSIMFYIDLYNRDFERNKNLLKIADYLSTSDYDSGYATFWNSNILVEFTNGKLSMYTWTDSGSDGSGFRYQNNPKDLYAWLIPVEHLNNPPKGKVFVLYRNNEIPYCNWQDKLQDSDIILKTDLYTVYGYDSYDSMMKQYGY